MEKIKFNPADFAAAYIQTLPHALDSGEFSSNDDYNEYLKERREIYFFEYIEALDFANNHELVKTSKI